LNTYLSILLCTQMESVPRTFLPNTEVQCSPKGKRVCTCLSYELSLLLFYRDVLFTWKELTNYSFSAFSIWQTIFLKRNEVSLSLQGKHLTVIVTDHRIWLPSESILESVYLPLELDSFLILQSFVDESCSDFFCVIFIVILTYDDFNIGCFDIVIANCVYTWKTYITWWTIIF